MKILSILLFTVLFSVVGCSQLDKSNKSDADKLSPQLLKVLEHYKDDPQKLAAAQFLIDNMPGHCYVKTEWAGTDDVAVEFDSTCYRTFDQALTVLEEIEKEHGELNYRASERIYDVDVVTAEYLINNIDLAFKAWRSRPWAADMSFDTFCEYILPYRCSNEPVDSWRGPLMGMFIDLEDEMIDPKDPEEAAKIINKRVNSIIRFDSVYYLHPTDQGYSEMRKSGMGRCEDISNMISYAMRANCVAVASDYTPAWANRDNNHAWNAVLDKDGHGNTPVHNIPAKVYRKLFSIQKNAPVFRKKEGERVPRWLGGKNYIDVTNQYIPVGTVELELKDVPVGSSIAYLAVFNGGEWVCIADADIVAAGTAAAGTAGVGTAGVGTAGVGTAGAGTGTAGVGTAGVGTAGAGTAGAGTAGVGTAGVGTAGVGTAGVGTAGAGTGTAGVGTAGVGTAGAGTAGAGTAGVGTAGVGTAGVGTAGVGTAGVGTAGAGTAGAGTAGTGTVDGKAVFKDMGQGIVYLPVYYVPKGDSEKDGQILAAADPIILHKDGRVEHLSGNKENLSFQVSQTKPKTGDDDTLVDILAMKVEAGKQYVLVYWHDGKWQNVATKNAENDMIMFENVPGGFLYWVYDTDGRKLERIFTFNSGELKFW